jgi:WD40 repeat protein
MINPANKILNNPTFLSDNILAGSVENKIYVINLNSKEEIKKSETEQRYFDVRCRDIYAKQFLILEHPEKKIEGFFPILNLISFIVPLPNYMLASSGSNEKTIAIWDWKSGRIIFDLPGHKDKLICATSLPNNLLATASKDKSIKIWNLKKGECLKTIDDFSHDVTSLTTLNKQLVSGHDDGTIIIWNLETNTYEKIKDAESILTITTTQDGKILTGLQNGNIGIWQSLPEKEKLKQSTLISTDTPTTVKNLKTEITELTQNLEKYRKINKNIRREKQEIEVKLETALCSICYNNISSVTFLDCNHMCCCKDCADEILNKKLNCPMCRGKIKTAIYPY